MKIPVTLLFPVRCILLSFFFLLFPFYSSAQVQEKIKQRVQEDTTLSQESTTQSYAHTVQTQERTVPVILSLWNPVATTPYDSLTTTWLNLGFQSRTHHVDGLALNLFAHRNYGDLSGMQFAAFSSFTRGTMHGLQISAFYNAAGRNMRGVQVAALQNTAIHGARGFQLAGVSNFVIGNGRGLQLAGLTNIAGSRFRGVQLAAGINLASSSGNTVQISGLSNICADTLVGVQISAGNYAGTLRGVQIGLLNVCAGEVKGLQIGLVNRSADTMTVKIGLVNLSPITRIAGLFYIGNTTKFNFAARFTNKYFYTMPGIGFHYRDLDASFSGSLFYRAGHRFVLIPKRFFISGDLGFAHIENFKENEKVPRRMYSLQARLNLECHFRTHFGLFASGGFAHTRHYRHNRVYENKPILELGVVVLK